MMNIPEYYFATKDYDISDQFDVFQTKMAAFGLRGVASNRPAKTGYDAITYGYSIDSILLFGMQTEGYEGVRDDRIRKSNDIDHWALSFWRSGAGNFDIGGRKVRIGTGQLKIESVAKPNPGVINRNDTIYVMLQRDKLKGLEAALDSLCRYDGSGEFHPLLKEYTESLLANIQHASPSEYAAISDATVAMVRACTLRSPDAIAEARHPIMATQLAVAKKIIQQNIWSADLDSQYISGKMRMSLRKIYKLFEQEGGVDSYIRKSRLNAIYRSILLDGGNKTIIATSQQFGFQDAASFGRQFRSQFGVTPVQVREHSAHPATLILESFMAGSGKTGTHSTGLEAPSAAQVEVPRQ